MIGRLVMLVLTLGTSFRDRTSVEEGASLIEYALLLALVVGVAIGALVAFGVIDNASLGNSANAIGNGP